MLLFKLTIPIILKLLLCHICLSAYDPLSAYEPSDTVKAAVNGIVTRVKTSWDNGKKKTVIVSDFNGVLIRNLKNEQKKNEQIESLRPNVLEPISTAKHITFYVSSSKPKLQLEEIFKEIPDIGLAAEHCMTVRHPTKDEFVEFTNVGEKEAKETLASVEDIAKIWGLTVQEDTNDEKKTHIYSRNFRYHGSKEEIDNFCEAFNEQVQGINPGFEAVRVQGKQVIMVASTLRGKANLVEKLIETKVHGYGIALGDKPADLQALIEMQKEGYAGIAVGGIIKSQALHENLIHFDSPDDVHYLLIKLALLYKRN